MNMDEYALEREASAPIDMLETYFSAMGWAAERAGEDEIVSSFQGSWTQYELRGIWRAEDQVLQFLALPDIRVAAEKRDAVYEAIGLINEQLWLGHFELWSASGLVLFRHAALLDGENNATLSLQQAETLVEAAIEECERFYPVFQFVLWADKTPQEAIAAALIETQGEA
ncbi:YbjN domain-containing protein [Sphingosinicella sp.]|uniref:YbjN domain-containing protein n=1 Tax=Sphingosinicella sp. TaxID=1917971 RepID=UPI0040378712